MKLPRGQKTSPEMIHRIVASWVTTNNYKQTARDLGIPVTTVKKIVDENKDKPEFIELRRKQAEAFSDKASEIIMKGLTLLNRRLDRAIESEDDLDIVIDEIFATDREELSDREKQTLISKIRALQLHDIKALTTAIGTLYDKRALSDGKPTGAIEIIGSAKLDKLAELAGYEKRE